jgi:hypothetical protein
MSKLSRSSGSILTNCSTPAGQHIAGRDSACLSEQSVSHADRIAVSRRGLLRNCIIGAAAVPAVTAGGIRVHSSGVSAQGGTVEEPPYQDRLVPDENTNAWDDLGPRDVRGIVYHRLEAPLEGMDSFLRSMPTGGPNFCEPQFGGCVALFDFGIDHDTGSIIRWNDPTGDAHPGVSPNRSGWANGPAVDPTGEASAFLTANNHDLEVINRYQVSIAISGGFQDPISDDCITAVAWLSAYFADSTFPDLPDLTLYPTIPDEGFSFVRLHNEFDSQTECPGEEVERQLQVIFDRTREVMQFYRS